MRHQISSLVSIESPTTSSLSQMENNEGDGCSPPRRLQGVHIALRYCSLLRVISRFSWGLVKYLRGDDLPQPADSRIMTLLVFNLIRTVAPSAPCNISSPGMRSRKRPIHHHSLTGTRKDDFHGEREVFSIPRQLTGGQTLSSADGNFQLAR